MLGMMTCHPLDHTHAHCSQSQEQHALEILRQNCSFVRTAVISVGLNFHNFKTFKILLCCWLAASPAVVSHRICVTLSLYRSGSWQQRNQRQSHMKLFLRDGRGRRTCACACVPCFCRPKEYEASAYILRKSHERRNVSVCCAEGRTTVRTHASSGTAVIPTVFLCSACSVLTSRYALVENQAHPVVGPDSATQQMYNRFSRSK